MEKRHRVFIAINLPEDIKRELAKYSEKWPELPAKWTAKDNLHITLEFLGDLTDTELADACKIAGEVAQRHKNFPVDLNKVLYGPPKKMPPRFVWVNGEKSEELADLKEDLQECLMEKISFKPEGRSFTPHITLARILEWQFRQIEPEERPEINEDIFPAAGGLVFSVESIEIMESKLRRGGPVYAILESHTLGS